MRPRLIFGRIDGEPPMWLLVKYKIMKPDVGNTIYVRSFAIWMSPQDWIKVRVESLTIVDGFTQYSLKRLTK